MQPIRRAQRVKAPAATFRATGWSYAAGRTSGADGSMAAECNRDGYGRPGINGSRRVGSLAPLDRPRDGSSEHRGNFSALEPVDKDETGSTESRPAVVRHGRPP